MPSELPFEVLQRILYYLNPTSLKAFSAALITFRQAALWQIFSENTPENNRQQNNLIRHYANTGSIPTYIRESNLSKLIAAKLYDFHFPINAKLSGLMLLNQIKKNSIACEKQLFISLKASLKITDSTINDDLLRVLEFTSSSLKMEKVNELFETAKKRLNSIKENISEYIDTAIRSISDSAFLVDGNFISEKIKLIRKELNDTAVPIRLETLKLIMLILPRLNQEEYSFLIQYIRTSFIEEETNERLKRYCLILLGHMSVYLEPYNLTRVHTILVAQLDKANFHLMSCLQLNKTLHKLNDEHKMDLLYSLKSSKDLCRKASEFTEIAYQIIQSFSDDRKLIIKQEIIEKFNNFKNTTDVNKLAYLVFMLTVLNRIQPINLAYYKEQIFNFGHALSDDFRKPMQKIYCSLISRNGCIHQDDYTPLLTEQGIKSKVESKIDWAYEILVEIACFLTISQIRLVLNSDFLQKIFNISGITDEELLKKNHFKQLLTLKFIEKSLNSYDQNTSNLVLNELMTLTIKYNEIKITIIDKILPKLPQSKLPSAFNFLATILEKNPEISIYNTSTLFNQINIEYLQKETQSLYNIIHYKKPKAFHIIKLKLLLTHFPSANYHLYYERYLHLLSSSDEAIHYPSLDILSVMLPKLFHIDDLIIETLFPFLIHKKLLLREKVYCIFRSILTRLTSDQANAVREKTVFLLKKDNIIDEYSELLKLLQLLLPYSCDNHFDLLIDLAQKSFHFTTYASSILAEMIEELPEKDCWILQEKLLSKLSINDEVTLKLLLHLMINNKLAFSNICQTKAMKMSPFFYELKLALRMYLTQLEGEKLLQTISQTSHFEKKNANRHFCVPWSLNKSNKYCNIWSQYSINNDHDFLKTASVILNEYCQYGSEFLLFARGYWNRHHVEDVKKILNKINKKELATVEQLFIELSLVFLINPNGSFAITRNFLYSKINDYLSCQKERDIKNQSSWPSNDDHSLRQHP